MTSLQIWLWLVCLPAVAYTIIELARQYREEVGE